MVIKLLYKFQIDRKRNELTRVPISNCDGRTEWRSGETPRPALTDGSAGNNNINHINHIATPWQQNILVLINNAFLIHKKLGKAYYNCGCHIR